MKKDSNFIIGDSVSRQSAIKEVTDDLLTSKFISDVGQKALVHRETLQSDHLSSLREVLRDIGLDLREKGVSPKGMEYCGSLSIHIYKSEILKQAAFVTLSNTQGMPFDLADAGLRELTGSTHEQYGKARKKLRSKF